MRFRTLVVAALLLLLAATGAFAAYSIAEDARSETAQETIDRDDQLAVEPDIRQTLVSDSGHDPTAYGANGTETVEYNGTVWEPAGNYTYYAEEGEIEFLRDEPDPANISYQYDIPRDQATDGQLQTATVGFGTVMRLLGGLSLVAVFMFVGGFFARRMGAFGGNSRRGR